MRIIIVGKAGSGKDYLKKKFTNASFKPEISYTTRPIRDGEVSGETYHFISDKKFDQMSEDGKFYEENKFNTWRYGTTKYEFNTKNIFIQTPEGVAQIDELDRRNSLVIYLDIDEATRIKRLQERSDADTIERRLQADREQFKDFVDYDIKITNPNF